jgi:hypothetical protein
LVGAQHRREVRGGVPSRLPRRLFHPVPFRSGSRWQRSRSTREPHSGQTAAGWPSGSPRSDSWDVLRTFFDSPKSKPRVTRDSRDGAECAQTAASAAHYCHHQPGPTLGCEEVADTVTVRAVGQLPWARPWTGPVGVRGDERSRRADRTGHQHQPARPTRCVYRLHRCRRHGRHPSHALLAPARPTSKRTSPASSTPTWGTVPTGVTTSPTDCSSAIRDSRARTPATGVATTPGRRSSI